MKLIHSNEAKVGLKTDIFKTLGDVSGLAGLIGIALIMKTPYASVSPPCKIVSERITSWSKRPTSRKLLNFFLFVFHKRLADLKQIYEVSLHRCRASWKKMH